MIWRTRNKIICKDEVFLDDEVWKDEVFYAFCFFGQRPNTIQDGPSNIEEFIDWVGCKMSGGWFFVHPSCLLCSFGW